MHLGFGEIALILVLALLFFGPTRLPALGSSLGSAMRSFKKGLNGIEDEPVKPATAAIPPSSNTPPTA